MAIERVVDGSAEVVFDDSLSPILIATWWGQATDTTIDAFHAWVGRHVEAARVRGEKLALINDSIDAERPTPEGRRKFIATTLDASVLIALPTVVTNPLVRGAMTAVGWVLGERMKAVTSWPTLADAFEHARATLLDAGVRPPPASRLASYARPIRELRRA